MAIRKFSTASVSAGSNKSTKLWDQETFARDFEAIATAVVDSSGASTITFSSIPQIYKDLQVRYMARTTRSSSDGDYMRFRFNSDTTNNYSSQHWYGGDGSGVTASYDGATGPGIYVERITAASQASNVYGIGIVDILDYKSTNKTKVLKYFTGADVNGAFNTYSIRQGSGMWLTTDTAISSITINAGVGPNFTQYSHFALYGLRG